jgi:hypothetical protein
VNAPSQGSEGSGPPEVTGPSNGTRQRARSEDHVKMQRPWTRGASATGEMKRQATQQSPRHQTAMMARHFTTGHCADAPIPALGHDASTPTAPLNAASSTPSALHSLPPVLFPPRHLPRAMDPSASSAAAGSSSYGAKRRGCPPSSRNKPKVPALWAPRVRGPLRIGAPMQGAENRVASGTSMALIFRGPTLGGALNTPSPLVAVMLASRSAGSIDRALREAEAALGPLPPVANASVPQRVAPFATVVVATPYRLAAAALGPLIVPGSRFLELLIIIEA